MVNAKAEGEIAMAVVAKFQCISKIIQQVVGRENVYAVELIAATVGDENKAWSAATPAGHIAMTISNPAAFSAFTPGSQYIVTFVEETR